MIDWIVPNDTAYVLSHLGSLWFYEDYRDEDKRNERWTTRYNYRELTTPSRQLELIEVLPSRKEFAELRGRMHIVESIDSHPFEVFTYM
jgi:hypothetical protein